MIFSAFIGCLLFWLGVYGFVTDDPALMLAGFAGCLFIWVGFVVADQWLAWRDDRAAEPDRDQDWSWPSR